MLTVTATLLKNLQTSIDATQDFLKDVEKQLSLEKAVRQ